MKRKRRPSDCAFYQGWNFKNWPEAITTTAVLIAACALVTVFLCWAFITADKSAYKYTETTTYWVEPGDTLWKIAREYSTERQDIRRVIDIIEQENDCTANIYPGQCLTVPVFYK